MTVSEIYRNAIDLSGQGSIINPKLVTAVFTSDVEHKNLGNLCIVMCMGGNNYIVGEHEANIIWKVINKSYDGLLDEVKYVAAS